MTTISTVNYSGLHNCRSTGQRCNDPQLVTKTWISPQIAHISEFVGPMCNPNLYDVKKYVVCCCDANQSKCNGCDYYRLQEIQERQEQQAYRLTRREEEIMWQREQDLKYQRYLAAEEHKKQQQEEQETQSRRLIEFQGELKTLIMIMSVIWVVISMILLGLFETSAKPWVALLLVVTIHIVEFWFHRNLGIFYGGATKERCVVCQIVPSIPKHVFYYTMMGIIAFWMSWTWLFVYIVIELIRWFRSEIYESTKEYFVCRHIL